MRSLYVGLPIFDPKIDSPYVRHWLTSAIPNDVLLQKPLPASSTETFVVRVLLVLRYALVLGWRTRFAVAGVDQTNCRSQFQAVTQH